MLVKQHIFKMCAALLEIPHVSLPSSECRPSPVPVSPADLHITPAVEYAVCVQPFPEGFMVPLTSQHWLQVLRSQCNAADANASPDPLPYPHPHHPDLVSFRRLPHFRALSRLFSSWLCTIPATCPP